MLREFFYGPGPPRWLAWGGALALVFAAAAFQVGNSLVVDWYGRFYDQLQAAASLKGDAALADGLDGVISEMGTFAKIAMPLAVVAPLAKWIRAHFVFGWRMALVRAYLRRWDGAAAGAVPDTVTIPCELALRSSLSLQICSEPELLQICSPYPS